MISIRKKQMVIFCVRLPLSIAYLSMQVRVRSKPRFRHSNQVYCQKDGALVPFRENYILGIFHSSEIQSTTLKFESHLGIMLSKLLRIILQLRDPQLQSLNALLL